MTLMVSLSALGPAPSYPSEAKGNSLVLTRANVIDGISASPVLDVSVVIVDGRIERISRDPVVETERRPVIDLAGHWLLPGFVDAHAHIRDFASARRAVLAGTTTARVLGVDHFVDIGLRELHRRGEVNVPDIVASGYQVYPRLADAFFLDFPQMTELRTQMRESADLARMVAVLASRGVDTIKVVATERAGLPETEPRARTFADEELRTIVNEAQKLGLPVAAHAHGDEGAEAAIRAGVRSIEHGTFMSERTLKMMKEKDVCLIPTLTATDDLADIGGEYSDARLQIRGRAMIPRGQQITRAASKMGIRVVAGSDTSYSGESIRRVADEVIALSRAGLLPLDAIKAATSASAACVGVGGRTGSIRAGLEADLVVVERNPLQDIRNISEIRMVINDGRIALNGLDVSPRAAVANR